MKKRYAKIKMRTYVRRADLPTHQKAALMSLRSALLLHIFVV